MLEALKKMEEETSKKVTILSPCFVFCVCVCIDHANRGWGAQSQEVLRHQDELHKELLARELRLQEEVPTHASIYLFFI